MEQPYLSIIINFRNDDYQGGGFKRMETAVGNLIDQARRYRLRAELIIIDWNSPEGKPLLKDVISFPEDLGPLKVRFIVVPPSFHKKLRISERININIPAAWNVGIRRAKGEFILPTNSDILFSDELIQFLSSKNLSKDYFYRAIRYGVARDVLKYPSMKDQMDFWQLSTKQGDLKNSVAPHNLANHQVLLTMCGADFLVFSREKWFSIHGYPETNPLCIAADDLVCYMAYLSGLAEKVLEDPLRAYHIDHDSRWHHLYQNKLERFLKKVFFNKLKVNNAFRVIARTIYNFKYSSKRFFLKLYYGMFDSLIKKYAAPEKMNLNRYYIEWQYRKVLLDMLKGKRSYIYNDDNWGFPNENFQEFIVSK